MICANTVLYNFADILRKKLHLLNDDDIQEITQVASKPGVENGVSKKILKDKILEFKAINKKGNRCFV